MASRGVSGAPLRIADRGRVRHIVLDRPAQRNALSAALMRGLVAALEDADAAPEIGAVVLRGEGPGFCAGADLKEVAAIASDEAVADHARLMASLLLAPAERKKPVVAQVHGFALGAGCGLALACDVAIAGEGARLGYPEAAHGMLPALVVPMLMHSVGRKAAFDLLASGKPVDAARAASRGLVTRVVPDEALADEVNAAAESLATTPTPVAEEIKALLAELAGKSLGEAMRIAERTNVEARLRRRAAGRSR